MLNNILKLEGAQKLSKNEQKGIKGAGAPVCTYPKKAKLIIKDGEPVWVCM